MFLNPAASAARTTSRTWSGVEASAGSGTPRNSQSSSQQGANQAISTRLSVAELMVGVLLNSERRARETARGSLPLYSDLRARFPAVERVELDRNHHRGGIGF